MMGLIKHQWVYTGIRPGRETARIHVWSNTNDMDGEIHAFKKNIAKGVIVGDVYDVTIDDTDNSVFVSGEHRPVFVETLPATDKHRQEWDATHRSETTLQQAQSQARKQHKEAGNPFSEMTLEELTSLYWSMRTTQRTALLTRVIAHISGHRIEDK